MIGSSRLISKKVQLLSQQDRDVAPTVPQGTIFDEVSTEGIVWCLRLLQLTRQPAIAPEEAVPVQPSTKGQAAGSRTLTAADGLMDLVQMYQLQMA